jgi:hypothetical protein
MWYLISLTEAHLQGQTVNHFQIPEVIQGMLLHMQTFVPMA